VRFALKVAGTASFGSLYRRSSNYEKPLSPVSDVPLKEGKKVAREAFRLAVRTIVGSGSKERHLPNVVTPTGDLGAPCLQTTVNI
jgi:hypothetical protein